MNTVVTPKGQRATRSTVLPSASASTPKHPQNPHYLNSQSHALNSQSEMDSSSQPSTPPRTPRRDGYTPHSSQKPNNPTETGSKQKPRGKRPKNVITSPPFSRKGHNSPSQAGANSADLPSSSKPISTPSTAAYAGSTFHASPAPSALPIPTFYSKSVPESPAMKEMKAAKALNGSSISPPPNITAQAQREESPLDFFFKADREEKARARSATQTTSKSGPFPPPSDSPRSSQTPPGSAYQNRPHNTKRISSSGMFAMELDGDNNSGSMYGPAFSTPYAERINAARSASFAAQPPSGGQQTMTSEALKAVLFSSRPIPSTAGPLSNSGDYGLNSPLMPSSSTAQHHPIPSGGNRHYVAPSRTPFISNNGRSSGLRQEVTPTKTPTRTPDRNSNYAVSPTPARIYENPGTSDTLGVDGAAISFSPSSYSNSSGNSNVDLKGMEDSLRRILKLDSGSSGPPESKNISTIPAVSASVPNYVSGRRAPMTNVHSGVRGS
ncbi:hypothetical protein B0O99DRAFT_736897 [Bisporella sp. PMI_857]|nr:hypothetical protein B0O99DRAFT_736897 [Bisporella sp. PMI_857]